MKPGTAKCSFCDQSYHNVGPLVEGPDGVYICGECVSLCDSILDQEKRRRKYPNGRNLVVDASSIRETLDNLVLNHRDAKAALVEAAISRDNGKARVLLIGPSQTSAMFLAKALAHAIDGPFAKGDPLGLLKSGQGNPLFDLLYASDFDIESAKQGVLFLIGTERPVSQDMLLQLWQTNIASPVAGLEFDAQGVLFVCGATYAGLDETVLRLGRHREQPITADAVISLGARPDWVEAMTAIAPVSPLDEQTLMAIVNWIKFPKELESA